MNNTPDIGQTSVANLPVSAPSVLANPARKLSIWLKQQQTTNASGCLPAGTSISQNARGVLLQNIPIELLGKILLPSPKNYHNVDFYKVILVSMNLVNPNDPSARIDNVNFSGRVPSNNFIHHSLNFMNEINSLNPFSNPEGVLVYKFLKDVLINGEPTSVDKIVDTATGFPGPIATVQTYGFKKYVTILVAPIGPSQVVNRAATMYA